VRTIDVVGLPWWEGRMFARPTVQASTAAERQPDVVAADVEPVAAG